MDDKCSECGMIGFHKMSCSQQYKSKEDLKASWQQLKEMSYYQHEDKLGGKLV